MLKILLVDDDIVFAEAVSMLVTSAGYEVSVARSIDEFRQIFNPKIHNIVIMDLGLPDGDGMSLVSSMRREGYRTALIVLTARSDLPSKINGLQEGADYYITKGAGMQELVAIIRVIERRMNHLLYEPLSKIWTLRESSRKLVAPSGLSVSLSNQDYLVMRSLLQNKKVVTRRTIIQALGSDYINYDQRRLDTQILRLRKRVRSICGCELPIITIRSVGYTFTAPFIVMPLGGED